MNKNSNRSFGPEPSEILLPQTSRKQTIPLIFVGDAQSAKDIAGLSPAQRRWLGAIGFEPAPGRHALLPGDEGDLAGVIWTLKSDPDTAPGEVSIGSLPALLPQGDYHFEDAPGDAALAVLFWLLGSYSFTAYKTNGTAKLTCLKLPKTVDRNSVCALAEAVFLGRNLINTPANDLGPAELEAEVRRLGKTYRARVNVVTGDQLLQENFPMIHAVGRASDRAPRLIDMAWGRKTDVKVTLVGKGICFDTGGLNIKPGNSMALMKKDMGGAAAAISLAKMIMDANLPVRLRLLIPAADNNISANAFRPGDVLASRNGMTVEIGNTDAEGRLVLADALALADEGKPDYLFNFATLTGSARVALGPDLPALYAEDDGFAEALARSGMNVGDPVWRLPLWQPYNTLLAGQVGDVNHIHDSPFAGSITAALFLKRFVTQAKTFAHFDIFGWVPSAKPGKPQGGEPQAARAVFDYLQTGVLA